MSEIRIFEVGGSIRNEIIGIPPNDRDFTVLAPSYQYMKDYLVSRGATIYQERPQFVSIKAKLDPIGSVDFTLARQESFYTDGRHPDSVTPAHTIEQDLARRDFRMNAIAREVGTNTLIDPFNGQEDIAKKLIKCVDNTHDRFAEDKLRIFRALRFSCQLDFVLCHDICETIPHFASDMFDSVSPERLQSELAKMFKSNTTRAVTLLNRYYNLLNVIRFKKIWLKPTLESK